MATIETYAFGLEFIVLLVSVNMNDKLRHKLLYYNGIPIKDLPMDIVNQFSATSPWQNQSKIKIVSFLCILPQTRKENFLYILY